MHRIRVGTLVAALAFTLAIAGCGGDDPLTRAELTREASAICKRMNDQTLEALKDAQKEDERIAERGPAFADLVAEVAEIRRTAADDLDALVPPDELSADYDRLVKARQASVDLLPTEDQAEAGDDPNVEKRNAQETTVSNVAQRLRIRC